MKNIRNVQSNKAELFPFETFMTLILTNNRKTQHSSKSKGVIITCFENPEVWLVFIKIGQGLSPFLCGPLDCLYFPFELTLLALLFYLIATTWLKQFQASYRPYHPMQVKGTLFNTNPVLHSEWMDHPGPVTVVIRIKMTDFPKPV